MTGTSCSDMVADLLNAEGEPCFMDEIEDRLRSISGEGLKAYEQWKSDEKNSSARESLRESIHELRKLASRLEIEMAVSERREMSQTPIPIPPHRAAMDRGRTPRENSPEEERSAGPAFPDVEKKPRRRVVRRPPSDSAE